MQTLALIALLVVWPGPAALALSTTPDFSFESNQADALLGNNVSAAGDVNGDGYDDVFVSAPRYDNGEIDEGRIYLFLGSAAGLEATPAWTFEPDVAGAQVRPTAAGDVDGDGFDDAIVGAGGFDGDQLDEGRVWIFRGAPGGLETTAFWIVDGNQQGAFFGGDIAAVGDVNGDGFGDVLIGAVGYDNDQVDEGAAFLYFGSSTGPSTTADWMAEGNQTLSLFGRVAAAGDVNGDGYSDFLIGAGALDDGEVDEGAAFFYLGSMNGPRNKVTMLTIDDPGALFGNNLGSAGDVNGDGFDDIYIRASGAAGSGRVFIYHGRPPGLTRDPVLILSTTPDNVQFGTDNSGAGDVNGDGFDDLIVGARLFDGAFVNQGRAFVYAGSSSGLNPVPLQTFDGTQAGEELGVSVSTAGDVNGDGFSDVLIGAHAFDNPQVNEGRALVFHGGP